MRMHDCLGINHLSALAFKLLVICYCDVRVHILLQDSMVIELQPAASSHDQALLMLAFCYD